MKRILQISLVLNVVLIAAVGVRSTRESPMLRTPRGEVRQANQKMSNLRGLPRTAQSDPATPWSSLENRDPRQFIENLRAIGCPEQTVRDIVTLRVCREFRNQLVAVEAAAALSWDYTHQQDRQHLRERSWLNRDLRDDMITTLESLFGQSWQSLTPSLLVQTQSGRDSLESFSVEARRHIREVEKKFRREMNELQQRQGTGGSDLEDAARIRELELQKQAELAGVLAPHELEEYLYRKSPAADYIRRNAPGAKSESEYRAMVKLALQMEMSGSVDTPDRRAVFDQALKEMLTEPRFTEQQAEELARAEAVRKEREAQNDFDVRGQITELAESVGIGGEDANRFFNRIKELQPVLKAKFNEMQKGLTGSDKEKQKQMEAASRAELERIAVETIGEKGRELVKKMIEAEK